MIRSAMPGIGHGRVREGGSRVTAPACLSGHSAPIRASWHLSQPRGLGSTQTGQHAGPGSTPLDGE
jgi:hypothetical protein